MALRAPVLALGAVLVLALLLGVPPARAGTVLGTANPDGPRDAFACAGSCPSGSTVGFRQFALQGATVEAPEAGVLVSARAYVRRIAGNRQPEIAVVRPAGGIRATIAGTAPLPASSPGGALAQVGDLHLPVQAGDSLAMLLPAGQVDVGVRARPSPDGAVVSFTLPCAPCGTDAGTGRELLFQGTIEPDVDADLLGDESQDPDGGFASDEGLFEEEVFDEELFDEEARPRRRGRLRLLRARPRCDGGATLLLAAPGAGRLTAVATRVARRRPRRRRAAPARRVTIATGRTRSTRAGRVRLGLRPLRAGRRLLAKRGRLRTRLEVAFRPRRGRSAAVTDALTLRKRACRHERSRKAPRARQRR